jgi:glycerol-3-phosphate cytidylyltransferase
MLMFLPITMRICGEEYKEKHLTGRDICDNRGIKTYYNSRTHRFSSSELRQRTYQSELNKVTK